MKKIMIFSGLVLSSGGVTAQDVTALRFFTTLVHAFGWGDECRVRTARALPGGKISVAWQGQVDSGGFVFDIAGSRPCYAEKLATFCSRKLTENDSELLKGALGGIDMAALPYQEEALIGKLVAAWGAYNSREIDRD